MNYKFIIILLGCIIAESTAQYFTQKTIVSSDMKYLFIGMLIYSFVAVLYYLLLKEGTKLALANTFWNVGTTISVALVGYLIFNQSLNYKQIFGIFITILGVSLV